MKPAFTICAIAILVGLPQMARALSFHDALDLAWARAETRIDATARAREAGVRADAARSIFPNAPFVSGTYDDDHALGYNLGYTTYQGEIGTPLWLPGEGTATERTALADAQRYAAEGEAGRQDLAYELLSDIVVAIGARAEERLAKIRLESSNEISRDIGRANAVGEVGSADGDAAEGARASAEIAVAGASAQARLADETIEALIGIGEIPTLPDPGQAAIAVAAARTDPGSDTSTLVPDAVEAGLVESAPHVAAARRGVEAATANLRLARLANRDDPDVGIEALKDKQFGSPWDVRVGVVVHIPLPSYARNAPRIAAAETTLSIADAALVTARRRALLRMRDAATELRASAQARASAGTAARALERRRVALMRAWRVGETPLIEVLRAIDGTYAAQSTLARADLDMSAALVRTQLADGMSP